MKRPAEEIKTVVSAVFIQDLLTVSVFTTGLQTVFKYTYSVTLLQNNLRYSGFYFLLLLH